jgi:anti-sigma regulatory factor (Ser/Thr protein kinase)
VAFPIRLHGYHVSVKVLRSGSASRRARAVVRQVLQEAGVEAASVSDAELAVGELAANAETHARPPYELRIVTLDGSPTWCEVVDGDPDPAGLPQISLALRAFDPFTEWARESGRGLLLVHQLSEGRCRAYPTRTCATGVPGKAVGFALPSASDPFRAAPARERGAPYRPGVHLHSRLWAPQSPATLPRTAASPWFSRA